MDGWLIDITPSGIRTLVQRSPPKKGQQLCLCAERTDLPDVFRLSDDKEELKVIFLRSAREKLVDSLGNGPFSKALVGIRDVIVGNADRILNDDPLVLVADLEIVVPERNGQEGPPKTQWKWIKPKNGQLPRVRGGLIGTFLKEWAPSLSNEELAGSGVWSRALSPVTSLRKDMETVSAFLEHHSAIQTLHRSQSGGLGTGSSENIMTTSYFAALKSFEEAQMDRQKVSLTSNAGRETVVGAARVVDQYKKCLEVALSCPTTDFLSVDMLCEWHKVLCGEGIHPDAGNLRHKWVNVGQTSFRCPEDVQRDLQDVCIAIRVLESRLLRNMARNKDRGLFLATFAAVVLMGIVDVHPFADGNGRLSKIAVNWALRRGGLPFVVHLFATPAQYFQFTKSIRLTRRNIVLHSKGQVTQDQLLDGYRSAGALFPLVQLILDRLGKTVAEFQKVVQEKLSQMSEEDESRAARRYRERAAQGNCLICFGDNPNIATLCCGKAVHLNCVAEWLSQQNSCPQCRSELPKLSTSTRAPPAEGVADDVADDFSTTSSVYSDTAIDEATSVFDAEDSTNEEHFQQHDETITGDATEEDETNDDTIWHYLPPVRRQLPPFCSFQQCRNRSARDCSNQACGQCCLMAGTYSCGRHNT